MKNSKVMLPVTREELVQIRVAVFDQMQWVEQRLRDIENEIRPDGAMPALRARLATNKRIHARVKRTLSTIDRIIARGGKIGATV